MISGDEVDAFTPRSRRALRWRAGDVKRIKQAYNRRVRREGRADAAGAEPLEPPLTADIGR
jgi:hypothetical protein